jgi:hypothetical protein
MEDREQDTQGALSRRAFIARMAAVAFAAPAISTFVLEADALAGDGHQFCGNQTQVLPNQTQYVSNQVECPSQQGNDNGGGNNQGNDNGGGNS